MNKHFFTLYQYLGPLILTPLSFYLWWETYEGNLALTLNAWLMPIFFAYIIPGVGTNILKIWEFNTRYRLGKFRPHHGFVFGSATAMIAWLSHTHMATDIFDVIQSGFIIASVLGFWNLIYDVKALQAGILLVYNQPWAENRGEEAIAMDYAPVFFAGFGFIYGISISIAELFLKDTSLSSLFFIFYFIAALLIAIALPVALYRYDSFQKYGHDGCKPIRRK